MTEGDKEYRWTAGNCICQKLPFRHFTIKIFLYNNSQNIQEKIGRLAQLVERLLCMQKVKGSIPLVSTFADLKVEDPVLLKRCKLFGR
jgi:hypothetical protein